MENKNVIKGIRKDYNELLNELINIKLSLNDMKIKSIRLSKNKFNASAEELFNVIKEGYLDVFVNNNYDIDNSYAVHEVEVLLENLEQELSDSSDKNKGNNTSNGKLYQWAK